MGIGSLASNHSSANTAQQVPAKNDEAYTSPTLKAEESAGERKSSSEEIKNEVTNQENNPIERVSWFGKNSTLAPTLLSKPLPTT